MTFKPKIQIVFEDPDTTTIYGDFLNGTFERSIKWIAGIPFLVVIYDKNDELPDDDCDDEEDCEEEETEGRLTIAYVNLNKVRWIEPFDIDFQKLKGEMINKKVEQFFGGGSSKDSEEDEDFEDDED